MPIKKDKMFFFVSYQETRQINGVGFQGYSATSVCRPSRRRSFRHGRFPGRAGRDVLPIIRLRTPSVADSMKVACDGSNINPVAINILNLKLPNGSYYVPGSDHRNRLRPTRCSIPAHFTEHQAVANYDYLINSKNTLAARFFTTQDPQTIPASPALNGECFPAPRPAISTPTPTRR